MKLIVAVALAFTTTLAAADAGRAAGYEGAWRVGLKGAFGFGGEGSGEVDGWYGDAEDDLEATTGFGLFGFYPLHRYVHIGAQTVFGWSQTETSEDLGGDSTFFMDISPVLKGRIPLLADKLELYALVPVGLTISVPPDDRVYGLGEVESGVGWNLGVQVGTSYLVYEGLALLAEMGWQGRWSSNDSEYGREASGATHQFALNVGLSYAF